MDSLKKEQRTLENYMFLKDDLMRVCICAHIITIHIKDVTLGELKEVRS